MDEEQQVDTTHGRPSAAPGRSKKPQVAVAPCADPAAPSGNGELHGTAEPEQTEGETVAGELALLAAQRDDYLALAQRTQADFENYRKRVARDAKAAELRGVARLARELLPALDNLDRAVAAAAEGSDAQLIEGLRLVQRELRSALERVGIESYGEAGEEFDPERHEAVAAQSRDGAAAGTVLEVFQSGYRLAGGGILRAARVLVAG
jgi:molecular chaperone GrpE